MRFIFYFILFFIIYRVIKYYINLKLTSKKNYNNNYYKTYNNNGSRINEKDIIDAEFEEIKNNDDSVGKDK